MKPRIHVVSEFCNATGGTELRAINLYRMLAEHAETSLWSIDDPPDGLEAAPIRKINTKLLRFPRGGTLVLVGAYFNLGTWLSLARPKRVILVYNTPDPERLVRNIDRIRMTTGLSPEVRFTSETLRRTVNVGGSIETSLIDLTPLLSLERVESHGFTVGRLSRAEEIKFHEHDIALFREVARSTAPVRIMGPSKSLATALDGVDDVELLPCGAEAVDTFLGSLDCFLYRTHSSWDEPWGRVIVEAMAAGLPVVCEPRGGYKELIDDGNNGFFFKNNDEALDLLALLQGSPSLRQRVGAEARKTAQEVLSAQVREAILASYLG